MFIWGWKKESNQLSILNLNGAVSFTKENDYFIFFSLPFFSSLAGISTSFMLISSPAVVCRNDVIWAIDCKYFLCFAGDAAPGRFGELNFAMGVLHYEWILFLHITSDPFGKVNWELAFFKLTAGNWPLCSRYVRKGLDEGRIRRRSGNHLTLQSSNGTASLGALTQQPSLQDCFPLDPTTNPKFMFSFAVDSLNETTKSCILLPPYF